MKREYSRIGVIGAGTIGIGVAEAIAAAGVPVTVVDLSSRELEYARERLDGSLRAGRLLSGGDGGEALDLIRGLIRFSTSYEDLSGAGIIVENITERIADKQALYEQLGRVCEVSCILAANTSAIPIAHLASLVDRPDRVVGVHFMNPVPRKTTVEVIRGKLTSAPTVEAILAFLERIGKQGIVVEDAPGFVSNRVLMLAINEAVGVVDDGVAPAASVDRIFRECFGHAMGPLETADLIGLDTILDTLEVLLHFTREEKFRPSDLLRRMVADGQRGRKTGRGFYDYE